MNTPAHLVSVVIPAYNAACCVSRAIDSALAQNYHPMEIIVVDDGSKDDTPAVLNNYIESIKVVRQANGGLSSARNTGILQANGEYVAFLDADDWWLPGKLEAQVEMMQNRPDIGFCSVATSVEDPEGNFLNLWPCPKWQGSFLENLFHQTAAVAGSGSGVLARRALFREAGLFDVNLDSLEDIDMWMRLAAVSGYACIPETLSVILKRQDSMSRNREVMRNAAIRVMKKNRALLPPDRQGQYWRTGLASLHADYAKWTYRDGKRVTALLDVLRAFLLAPLHRGRLCLGLLRDMTFGRPL